MPIRAVIFDLDDTLYPESQYVHSGYRAVAEHLRALLSRGEHFEGWLWQRFLAGKAAGAFDAMNDTFSLQLTAGQIQELVGVYRKHVPCIRPFDGMADMLGRLQGQYATGLLSDGFLPAQRLKLAALDMGRFFDEVIFTEDLGRQFWKPSTRGFELMAEKLGLQHEACCYVADNPAKDFLPGNQLGWRTVQYIRPGQIHAANAAPDAGLPQFIVRDGEDLHRTLLK